MNNSAVLANDEARPVVAGSFPEAAAAAFHAGLLCRDECLELVAGRLHQEGPACPECGASIESAAARKRWQRFERLQCSDCGKWFTAATGTWLAGAKLDPRQVFLLAALLELGIDPDLVARVVGASLVTVRYWRDKFRILSEVADD